MSIILSDRRFNCVRTNNMRMDNVNSEDIQVILLFAPLLWSVAKGDNINTTIAPGRHAETLARNRNFLQERPEARNARNGQTADRG